MIDQSRPQRYVPGIAEFTPVPRQTQRHDGWTADRQKRFIAALADLGSVRAAAHAVNMTPEGTYLLRRHPQGHEFREVWEAALALGVQRLEDVAMDRALNGVEVPVYHFGAVVGTRRVYNDRLLMFILRNRAPTRFAADSLVNADAATRSHLDRLKRDWRAQWEEEHLSQRAETAGQTSDKLTAKLETMHQRWLAAMTKPTRALYEAYKAAEAEDQAAHRTVWTEELEEREARDEEEEGAAACEAEERPSAAPDAADAKAESVLPGARPAAAPARQ